MAESVVDGNGSFQNQTKDVASTSFSTRSAARKAASAWKELQKKKPRGRYVKRVSGTSAEFEANHRRSASDIAADATKELEILAGYMPDVSDTDARVLALRLYYIELADGVSPSVAQDKVSKMFMVSSRTVKNWAASWEANHFTE